MRPWSGLGCGDPLTGSSSSSSSGHELFIEFEFDFWSQFELVIELQRIVQFERFVERIVQLVGEFERQLVIGF